MQSATRNIKPLHCALALLLLLCLCFMEAKSQTVQKAKNSSDGVYTKAAPDIAEAYTLSWQTLNTPLYSYDTAALQKAQWKIDYYKKYFASAPLSLKECVYVSPATDPGFKLKESILHHTQWQQPVLPYAFIFYSDTVHYEDPADPLPGYQLHLKLKRPIEDFYEPFYFKKTEVTNKEYREFVYWVLDSLERTLLAKSGDKRYYTEKTDDTLIINSKEKIHWEDTTVVKTLNQLYLPEEERYYHRREIDSRKIIYHYSLQNTFIAVYPDTLAWVHDFPGVDMEPHVNMYFWHPAYDDFPVAGISQLQAKAYLFWKTRQKQEELDRAHSDYYVEYQLPDELEWEMMETKSSNPAITREASTLSDADFRTDLLIREDTCCSFYKTIQKDASETGTRVYHLNLPADLKFKPDSYFNGTDAQLPGRCLYKAGLNYRKNKSLANTVGAIFKDENDVFFMGGNVSEWMQDNYQDYWARVYALHQQQLKKINSPYARIELELEMLENEKNDTNGVLVRGANWYDCSLAVTGTKNFTGMNKKRFINPMQSYSTIGFRYVVKVYRKNEMQTMIKDLPQIPMSRKQKRKTKREYKKTMKNGSI